MEFMLKNDLGFIHRDVPQNSARVDRSPRVTSDSALNGPVGRARSLDRESHINKSSIQDLAHAGRSAFQVSMT
jgi:hypothetical protein